MNEMQDLARSIVNVELAKAAGLAANVGGGVEPGNGPSAPLSTALSAGGGTLPIKPLAPATSGTKPLDLKGA